MNGATVDKNFKFNLRVENLFLLLQMAPPQSNRAQLYCYRLTYNCHFHDSRMYFLPPFQMARTQKNKATAHHLGTLKVGAPF